MWKLRWAYYYKPQHQQSNWAWKSETKGDAAHNGPDSGSVERTTIKNRDSFFQQPQEIYTMKTLQAKPARSVRVILNTQNRERHQWAKIVEGSKVLHTGQTRYIKRIAKKKFNLDLTI